MENPEAVVRGADVVVAVTADVGSASPNTEVLVDTVARLPELESVSKDTREGWSMVYFRK
jgi:hypothetical protein